MGHTSEEISLDDLRWDPPAEPVEIPTVVRAKRKRSRAFLRGPIPMAWISRATQCGPVVWVLGTELWRLAGFTKGKVVRPNLAKVAAFYGVSRRSLTRALADLAEAG